jgi:hypothetical protein
VGLYRAIVPPWDWVTPPTSAYWPLARRFEPRQLLLCGPTWSFVRSRSLPSPAQLFTGRQAASGFVGTRACMSLSPLVYLRDYQLGLCGSAGAGAASCFPASQTLSCLSVRAHSRLSLSLFASCRRCRSTAFSRSQVPSTSASYFSSPGSEHFPHHSPQPHSLSVTASLNHEAITVSAPAVPDQRASVGFLLHLLLPLTVLGFVRAVSQSFSPLVLLGRRLLLHTTAAATAARQARHLLSFLFAQFPLSRCSHALGCCILPVLVIGYCCVSLRRRNPSLINTSQRPQAAQAGYQNGPGLRHMPFSGGSTM